MEIICPKIGTGTDANPIRPLTEENSWVVIEEREIEIVILVLGGENVDISNE